MRAPRVRQTRQLRRDRARAIQLQVSLEIAQAWKVGELAKILARADAVCSAYLELAEEVTELRMRLLNG